MVIIEKTTPKGKMNDREHLSGTPVCLIVKGAFGTFSQMNFSHSYCIIAMRIVFFIMSLLLSLSSLTAQQLSTDLLKDWHWRLVGPSNPAGRAWTVVGVESDPKTLYVTTAGGGLWKSTNYGTTFLPVFNYESSASTGAVAVAKTNTSIVWVGTGEPASTRANSWGDGVYKSVDGGQTWKNMGLTDSREISSLAIHPKNPDIVYVAAMGYLWGTNSERGIFKTTDGGGTWTKSLFVNDTTGFIDLQMDPLNPEILYASAWQRLRWGDGDMTESGKGSGIYKTTNGGTTWEKLSNGLPTDPMGKIHLAVGRRNPLIVYANILTGEPGGSGRTSKQGGLFRSENGGGSWTRVDTIQTSYYYDRVYVDPADENIVWEPVFQLRKSTDGGRTFTEPNMKHVHNDLHSMWIDPNDPSHIVLSGDGGVSMTYDRCASWQQTVLPIGQFYEIATDTQDPYYVLGGMQDTGHWLGPSETYDEEGITAYDWIKLRHNGDGMGVAADPRDPNIIYMVQEFGNTSRLDLHTWDRTELQPTDTAEFRKRGITHTVRWDWTPAFSLSIHNPDILYLGSNYLFRINGKTGKWDAISPDLSKQQDKKVKGSIDGYHSYGSLFSVAESPFDKNVIWAGANDGPIWMTTDGGKHWEEKDGNFPSGTPTFGVVSKIEPSHFSVGTVYVAYDVHTREDIHPYLYKTTDGGRTWKNINGDLPEKGSTYVIREDPVNPNLLFVGTEFGVFLTIDGGVHWTKLRGNLPTAGVRAMVIQSREKELVVGTFGRCIWVTDISPFEEMSEKVLRQPLYLFKTKPATNFKLRETYGNTIEELNGDMFFRAENPPVGAIINYYLNAGSIDSVHIIIHNEQGNKLRTLKGAGTAGIHTVLWDLKKDALTSADSLRIKSEMTPGERAYRERVPVGVYNIELNGVNASVSGKAIVRNESHGVKRVEVRK
jgi:photosystem II stability/assembly factor-like uncharacterized protein